MLRATLKGIVGHKLRLAMTALAVTIGVAFVAGTFVLTDTINHTFDALFGQVNRGVDVSIRSTSPFSGQNGPFSNREPVPESLLSEVKKVAGVKSAEGFVGGYAQMHDKSGKAIGGVGPPTLGGSWESDTQLSPFRLRSGRAPAGPHDVVIDAGTARDHNFHVGDTMRIEFQGPAESFTVVGVAGFGTADNLAGATFAAFELRTAQRLFHRVGAFDNIDVAAQPGVTSAQLRDRIAASLPSRYEAVTGTKVADESAKSVKSAFSFLRTALLVFAFISLFVGSFIILNTFSIIVAQRSREMALYRALGASRRQVTRSVLLEAGAVGIVASAAGMGLGVLLALGLRAVARGIGIDLPSSATQFQVRTLVVSLVVGIGVSELAALVPARRAGRQPPVAVMRDVVTAPPSLGRRTAAGAVLALLGAAAMAGGFAGGGSQAPALVGLGVVLVFVAVAVLSPLLVEPITDVVGAPLPRLFGLPGRLAQENAGRNPRRTAATAAALMVGLALVCGVTVMAASIKASVGDRIDKALGADYILTSKQFSGFSTDVADELRDKPGIASVTSVRDGDWKLGDERKSLTSIDPPAVDHLVNLKVQSGSAASLGHGDVLVRKQEAKARHFNVGDVITMVFARSGAQRVRIGGIYKDAVLGEGSYVVSNAFYEANYSTVLDDAVLVKAASGVPLDRARASVDDVVRAFPSVKAEDHAEFKATQRSHVNQLLGLIYVLLALSVLIAVIGIVNTLALSILERTRELGLLRAVGMSRRQVRRMVRWESVLIALLGALLGVVLGIVFGLLIVSTLGDRGITHPTVPVGSLIGFMVFAAAMGVVAAILPARRASRLNILEAIASE